MSRALFTIVLLLLSGRLLAAGPPAWLDPADNTPDPSPQAFAAMREAYRIQVKRSELIPVYFVLSFPPISEAAEIVRLAEQFAPQFKGFAFNRMVDIRLLAFDVDGLVDLAAEHKEASAMRDRMHANRGSVVANWIRGSQGDPVAIERMSELSKFVFENSDFLGEINRVSEYRGKILWLLENHAHVLRDSAPEASRRLLAASQILSAGRLAEARRRADLARKGF